jgi:pyoverdine/dityrosine biosynthesis protein Dit1
MISTTGEGAMRHLIVGLDGTKLNADALPARTKAAHYADQNVCDTAERVLSVLTSSAYRKNSLARMNLTECRLAMLPVLRRRIRSEQPIQLTILAFPFKVPNRAKVGERRLPDFAELAAIYHMRSLSDAIQDVYPPGLEFHILHDGSLIAGVFGIDLQEVRQYETYFAKLVAIAGARISFDVTILSRSRGAAHSIL